MNSAKEKKVKHCKKSDKAGFDKIFVKQPCQPGNQDSNKQIKAGKQQRIFYRYEIIVFNKTMKNKKNAKQEREDRFALYKVLLIYHVFSLRKGCGQNRVSFAGQRQKNIFQMLL